MSTPATYVSPQGGPSGGHQAGGRAASTQGHQRGLTSSEGVQELTGWLHLPPTVPATLPVARTHPESLPTPVQVATPHRTPEGVTGGGHSGNGVGLHAAEALTPLQPTSGGQGPGARARGAPGIGSLSASRPGLGATQGAAAAVWPPRTALRRSHRWALE